MKVKSYINHDVSSIEYIFILNDLSVESSYLEDSTRIATRVLSMDPLVLITSSREDNKDPEKMVGTYNAEFTYKDKWNILVLTDKERTPLSIIYDTKELNTSECEKIDLHYNLDYRDTSSLNPFISVRDSMSFHIYKNEADYGHSHFIPEEISRSTETTSEKDIRKSIVTLTESAKFSVKDQIVTANAKDYSLDYVLNPSNLDLSSLDSSRDFLTCSRKSMYLIRLTTNSEDEKVGMLYNIAGTSAIEFELPEGLDGIKTINQVDNLSAIIAQDFDDKVYIWLRRRDGDTIEFNLVDKVIDLQNYDILIPTYMDLCSSYIKIPKIATSAPLTYEVCHWRRLLTETDEETYLATGLDYPMDKSIGGVQDSDMTHRYYESLSRENSKSYLLNPDEPKFSPVDKFTSDLRNVLTNPDSGILDMNLRLSACLFIDIYNNPRNEKWNYIIHDCGIELFDSESRYFIEYDSSITRFVPEEAVIMNKEFLSKGLGKYGFTLGELNE